MAERKSASAATARRSSFEPIARNWDWLDRVTGPVDADFAEAAAEEPLDQIRPQLDLIE